MISLVIAMVWLLPLHAFTRCGTSRITSSQQRRAITIVDADEVAWKLQEWIKTESLSTLLPKEELYSIIDEFHGNKDFWDRGTSVLLFSFLYT